MTTAFPAAAIPTAIELLDSNDVYDGSMARQTDAGLLAHRSISACIECMRVWSKDGSPKSEVSVRWVVKDVNKLIADEVSDEDLAALANAAIRFQVAKSKAAAEERKAAQAKAAAEEERKANAATPKQVAYLSKLLAREGHPDLTKVNPEKLTKSAASNLIDDILNGEVG